MNRTILAVILLVPLLAACSPAAALPTATPTPPPAPTPTPDACAGATDPGARQKFAFEQIVPCLDTPAKVSTFMANNVKADAQYDTRERGGNEYVPAAVVYQRGIDDADGNAILACYFLEKNGADAFVIGLSIESPRGSNVCGIQTAEGEILVLEAGRVSAGPFKSFADLAAYYINIGWMQKGGSLRTLKASQVTQITTDHTTPSVLDLPWMFQQY
jgi:hypothetical protein